jgi:hypothetical protein
MKPFPGVLYIVEEFNLKAHLRRRHDLPHCYLGEFGIVGQNNSATTTGAQVVEERFRTTRNDKNRTLLLHLSINGLLTLIAEGIKCNRGFPDVPY